MEPAPSDAAAWLARDAVDSLPKGALATKLEAAAKAGRPLRVKLGIDPTTPDIHYGHTVVLRKLREFQDAGHLVVLIIGDYTARVGDPSGRSATRPVVDPAEIDANAVTYQEQAFKVLDSERVEVRRNGEWLDMSMDELFRLVRIPTVAQLLEREDFSKRYKSGEPISVLELLYPIMQGYDSVNIDADIELGGTDQKFNLLLGRDLQRAYGKPEQAILTMPILPGTDGEKKMSKSLDNHVGVTDPPEDAYGKTMSIPDPAMDSWYRLLLGEDGVPADLSARDAKRSLAKRLVARFHGDEAAERAEADFDRKFIDHGLPDDIPVRLVPFDDVNAHLPIVIAQAFGVSNSEARRLIAQGAVRLDGTVVKELDVAPDQVDGAVLQVGKRKFAKLRRA